MTIFNEIELSNGLNNKWSNSIFCSSLVLSLDKTVFGPKMMTT